MKFQTEISFPFLLNLTYILYHIFGLIVNYVLFIKVLKIFKRFKFFISLNLIIILYHNFGPADNYFLSGTTRIVHESRGREWPPHLCHTEFFHRSRLQQHTQLFPKTYSKSTLKYYTASAYTTTEKSRKNLRETPWQQLKKLDFH